MEPYWTDGQVALYLGDCREVLPALGLAMDCIVTDPPYGETSLAWDRWPAGWPKAAAQVSRSLWCFGSVRMYLRHAAEFTATWRLSQDVVWEKGNGSGAAADRFRRVHEHVLHWYRGQWRNIHHEVPRTVATDAQVVRNGKAVRARGSAAHLGVYGSGAWTDDGTRLMRSVIQVKSMRGQAIHPAEKPVSLLTSLISYACPVGGLVLDPFAGSGSTLDAARFSGRRAVGVELHEPYAEAAARRLSQGALIA